MVGLAQVALKFIRQLILACLLIAGTLTASTLASETFSILSQNMNRLFDDVDNRLGKLETTARYRQRIELTASKLIHYYDTPEIIALQEVENIHVLQDIADRVRQSGGPTYQVALLEGNDISGIDIGYLVRSSLKIKQKKQLFKNDRLSLNHSPLFSRPPLLVEVCKHYCLTLVNVHLRSMRGLRTPDKSRRVAEKRLSQAEQLALWTDQFQNQFPDRFLMITGDFNALQPSDRYTDIIGILVGNPDNNGKRYVARDRIRKNLSNLVRKINPARRFSYVYKGKQQVLDYMLVSRNFSHKLKNIQFGEIDREFSDHAGLLAEFSW